MQLHVNGQSTSIADDATATLLEVLRDQLQLTGAKLACDRGECGACTVLIDGEPAYACLALAAACGGRAITTIEGLTSDGRLHPVQDAFIAHDAVQCGFCTPGQVLSAVALLARDPAPTDDAIARAMSGNLCRCGTYPNIRRAILALSASTNAGHAATSAA